MVVAIALSTASVTTARAADSAPVVFSDSVKPVEFLPATNGVSRPYISNGTLTAEQTAAPMKFEVTLKMRNFAELQDRVARGDRISTAEMAEKYEPLASDYQAAVDWATRTGLTILRQDDHHMALFLTGTVNQVGQALQVNFARVTSDGKEYTSAITAPSVPAAISTSLLGINGLQPHLRRHKHSIWRSQAQPAYSGGATYLPSQIATAYNVKPLYNSGVTGTGQTIAIVIDTFPAKSDLETFWQNTNINQSINNISFIQAVAGRLPEPSGEETLDVEWSSAMAPGANIRVYAATDLANEDLDQSYQQVLDDVTNDPSLNIHQMSMSYGEGETDISNSQLNTDAQFFAELAAQGVTCFASSGDEGPTPNDNTGGENGPIQVENPASDPSVTGVGGTTLILNSGNSVTSETVWNNDIGASGGGVSIHFARPSWQTGNGVSTSSMRQVPDIACAADPDYGAYVYFQGQEQPVGGTSWASPTCAAFCALINEARATAGFPTLGVFGSNLYSQIGTANLRDITSGNNATSFSDGKYVATAGYDKCTGVGVPLVDTLAQTLTNTSTGTPSQTSVTLSNLVTTYNGSPQSATVTTNPAGLNVTVTYNGSSTPPTDAGTYAVVATIDQAGYSGSVNGTLIINKAVAQIEFSNITTAYNGSPQGVTVTTIPSGVGVEVIYNRSIAPPTAVGSYSVFATVSDANYTGSETGTFTITKSVATVNLGTLSYTYTGKAQPATATTVPAGIPVTFTYNGKPTVPVNAGTYTVVATANSANAAGTGSGTLTINPEPATVTLTPSSLAAVYNGVAHAAKATTVPAGLAVTLTYNGAATAPVTVGNYTVVATISNPNYTGSTSETLVISPIAPLPTTAAATLIGANRATLNSTINPKGSSTTVVFQYGTTTAYSATTTSQTVAAGTAAVAVTQSINGLAPATLYHFRVVATSGGGIIDGADKTFTTLAQPAFSSNAAAYQGASGAEVTESVNPTGVATSVYFQYGTTTSYGSQTVEQSIGAGKTAVTVYALFPGLQPNKTYYYQMVTVSAAGTFDGPQESFTTLGFDTTLVAAKGDSAPGVTGGTFATFGNPAVNMNDDVAFAGSLTLGTGITAVNDMGIWADDNTQTLQLVARLGDVAPGTSNATFLTLSDPVYNNSEAVAFRGTLKVVTGEATTTTETGIWSTSGGSLALVARQGSQAPGYPTGATFATFTSLGLTDSDGAVIYATLNASTAAGVTAANNAGIWEGNTTSDLHLILRLGDIVGGKTITALTFLPTETYVNGQTRGFNTTSNSGDIVCKATFSNKTPGVVTVESGTPAIAVSSGSPAPGITTGSATFASFGNPAINTNDDIAFTATLTSAVGGVTAGTDLGIWAENAGTLQLIAQSGQSGSGLAPGTTASFLTFSDPVYNDNDAVAFRATLKVATGQATTTTATGIWSNSTGSLALVARQGGAAPGCPTGATFATFTELALPDQGGTVMLATLNANAAAGVTAANNLGIWAVDTTGTLQLIVRTGDILNGQTVTGLAFLPAISYVNGQSRSFAQENGDLVYLATFSDKSTAIFNVVFQ